MKRSISPTKSLDKNRPNKFSRTEDTREPASTEHQEKFLAICKKAFINAKITHSIELIELEDFLAENPLNDFDLNQRIDDKLSIFQMIYITIMNMSTKGTEKEKNSAQIIANMLMQYPFEKLDCNASINWGAEWSLLNNIHLIINSFMHNKNHCEQLLVKLLQTNHSELNINPQVGAGRTYFQELIDHFSKDKDQKTIKLIQMFLTYIPFENMQLIKSGHIETVLNALADHPEAKPLFTQFYLLSQAEEFTKLTTNAKNLVEEIRARIQESASSRWTLLAIKKDEAPNEIMEKICSEFIKSTLQDYLVGVSIEQQEKIILHSLRNNHKLMNYPSQEKEREIQETIFDPKCYKKTAMLATSAYSQAHGAVSFAKAASEIGMPGKEGIQYLHQEIYGRILNAFSELKRKGKLPSFLPAAERQEIVQKSTSLTKMNDGSFTKEEAIAKFKN